MARTLLVLSAILATTAFPVQAEAFKFGMELSPGVAIPASSFYQGVPVDCDLPDCQTPQTLLFDLYHKPGFSGGLAFLFDNWELRTDFFMLPFKTAQLTAIKFKNLSDQYYVPLGALQAVGAISGPTSADISGSINPAYVWTVVAGYRFYLTDTRFRPYIPVAFGLALAHSEGVSVLPGVTFNMGIGFEYRVVAGLSLGLVARYNWIAVRAPQTVGGSISSQGTQALESNQSLLNAVMASVHVVTLNATISYRF